MAFVVAPAAGAPNMLMFSRRADRQVTKNGIDQVTKNRSEQVGPLAKSEKNVLVLIEQLVDNIRKSWTAISQARASPTSQDHDDDDELDFYSLVTAEIAKFRHQLEAAMKGRARDKHDDQGGYLLSTMAAPDPAPAPTRERMLDNARQLEQAEHQLTSSDSLKRHTDKLIKSLLDKELRELATVLIDMDTNTDRSSVLSEIGRNAAMKFAQYSISLLLEFLSGVFGRPLSFSGEPAMQLSSLAAGEQRAPASTKNRFNSFVYSMLDR